MKVTIDVGNLGYSDDPKYVLTALRNAADKTVYNVTLATLANRIEAQLPKPKPEEPKGLGAVVRATWKDHTVRQGDIFIYVGAGWWAALDGRYDCKWDKLCEVEILSEGVEV